MRLDTSSAETSCKARSLSAIFLTPSPAANVCLRVSIFDSVNFTCSSVKRLFLVSEVSIPNKPPPAYAKRFLVFNKGNTPVSMPVDLDFSSSPICLSLDLTKAADCIAASAKDLTASAAEIYPLLNSSIALADFS